MIPFAPTTAVPPVLALWVLAWVAGRRSRAWLPPGGVWELATGILGGVSLSGAATLALGLGLGGELSVEPEVLTRGPWLVAAVGGTAAGEVFIAGLAGIGTAWPRGVSRQHWLAGLAAGPLFVLLSGAWVLGLGLVGVAPGEQVVATALLADRSWATAVALVSVTLVAPVLEEVVFRGWLLRWLGLRLPAGAALWAQALAFGAMHLEAPRLVPPLVLLGGGCGWLRQRSGALGPSILAHFGNNALAGVVLLGS